MDQLELVDGKLYLLVAPPSLLLGLHAQVDGQLFHAAARGHQLTKKGYGFQNLEQISQDFTGFKRFRKIERELQNLILNYRLV